jgi:hypothetical protein
MEFAAERAVGGEGLQDRAVVGGQGPQGFLQIAAHVAAETAVAKQQPSEDFLFDVCL